MRSNFNPSILLIFISFSSFGQSDSSLIKIEKTNSNYRAALYHENNVYAVAESGHVVIWNLSTLDTLPFGKNLLPINARSQQDKKLRSMVL